MASDLFCGVVGKMCQYLNDQVNFFGFLLDFQKKTVEMTGKLAPNSHLREGHHILQSENNCFCWYMSSSPVILVLQPWFLLISEPVFDHV